MYRCLFTVLCVSILAAPLVAAPVVQLANEHLALEIDLGLDGAGCTLTDKDSGEVYRSPDFGIIRVWDNTEDRMRIALMSSEFEPYQCDVKITESDETQATIRVTTGPGSPSAMGRQSFGVSFDIELALQDNTLEVAIPIDSLSEALPLRWRLMSIELFPRLGATPAGAPGYLVIPSWSGAVYYFDREHPRANRAYTKPGYGDLGTEAGLAVRHNFRPDAPAEYGTMVYGIQAAWEDQSQQPVYATIRDSAGLMALLISGEYDTEVRARRHQGPDRTSSINAIWHYRKYWHSKLDPVDRRMRLITLGPDNASYSGVGTILRDYLINECGVKTLRQRAATNPEVAYFMDSIYVRVMMGMKVMQLDGQGPMRSYQSWDDFVKAVDLFEDAGFEKVNFIFVGANFEGHDGAHPTVFPLEKEHGGEAAFKRVIARLDKADYRGTLHLNYKDCYTCSPDWDPAFVQVTPYGELRLHGAWIGGFSYQGIPQEMLERFGKRDLPKLRALGCRGMHYWDACLSVMEETFPAQHGVSNNRIITRREYGEGAIAYFKYAAEVFGTVGCETTIVPLLGTMVNAGNTSYPLGGAPGKFKANGFCEAGLLDHWVPLLHVVYHGLCCYGGGPELAGRTGTEFNETPTKERVDDLRARWLKHQEWGGPLEYEFISDHAMVAPMVFKTTFSDGTKIYVNKTNKEVLAEGVSLDARQYKVQRAN